jgi:hypothetical protein
VIAYKKEQVVVAGFQMMMMITNHVPVRAHGEATEANFEQRSKTSKSLCPRDFDFQLEY